MNRADDADEHHRPLRIAVLAKQVPEPESLELGADGRLRREGARLEMNPYCRRAVAKGVALAKASAGTCTAFTLGPPAAEDVLREAVAWGADEGVHLCDPSFAGSDTLATARALAAALRQEGPFDLVLVGRNSVDSGTGHVGPELAELLDLAFASGARRLRVAGGTLELLVEHEDGGGEMEVHLPALVSVAERLCAPCKVGPDGRAAVPARRIRRVTASQLGGGPWGEAASPTKVESTRALRHRRERRVLSGDPASQVATALHLLAGRGALRGPAVPAGAPDGPAGSERPVARLRTLAAGGRPAVAVLLEPDRPRVAAELLGAAARLSDRLHGAVVALVPPPTGGPLDATEAGAGFGELGADVVLRIVAPRTATPLAAEDVAAALSRWAGAQRPKVVLAPNTAFGCEVAARMAAALGAGLVGDAVTIDVVDGRLVAGKPAFSGTVLVDITCASPVQLVTVRPGVLDVPPSAARSARVECLEASRRGRAHRRSFRQDDEVDTLTRAAVVVGIGQGVHPDGYADVQALAAVLGAELAATRKVTDRGWAPRSRQVGITGRSIAPRLYVAIGVGGALNHMIGVRAAGTVLAINVDPAAPVFDGADVGIVGDWRQVVPLLTSRLEALRLSDRSAAAGGVRRPR